METTMTRTMLVPAVMLALAAPTAAVDFCADLEVVPVMGATGEREPVLGGGKPEGSDEDFSTAKVLDLQLEVRLEGKIPRTAPLGLELVSPNGHAYERKLVPIVALQPGSIRAGVAIRFSSRTHRAPGFRGSSTRRSPEGCRHGRPRSNPGDRGHSTRCSAR